MKNRDLQKQEKARLWKSESIEGVSLFKAMFEKFEYGKHTHDEFAIGVIEKGNQTFSTSFIHGGRCWNSCPEPCLFLIFKGQLNI